QSRRSENSRLLSESSALNTVNENRGAIQGEKSVPIGRLLIYGLGLIGGSLARAARERGLCREVVGVSRRQCTLNAALNMGVVDSVCPYAPDILRTLGAGDVVVVCVPTLTVRQTLVELHQYLDPE